MNIKQLIEELSELPENLEVTINGHEIKTLELADVGSERWIDLHSWGTKRVLQAPEGPAAETPPHRAELEAAETEMVRQDERWGEQNHPDWAWYLPEVSRSSYRNTWMRVRIDEANARRAGKLGWDLILLEEVYEALGEPDEDKRCEELVQAASVALQWVAAIRRRRGAVGERGKSANE